MMTLVHARYSPSLKVRKRLVGRWAARARRKVVPPPPYRHVGSTCVFSRGNQTAAFGSSSSLDHSSQFVLKRCLWKARIVFLEHIEPDKWDYFPVGRLRPQESPNYSATFRHLSQPPKGPRSVWLTWAPLLSASQFMEPSGNWTYAPP